MIAPTFRVPHRLSRLQPRLFVPLPEPVKRVALWAGLVLLGLAVGVLVAALPPFAALGLVLGLPIGLLLLASPRADLLAVAAVVTLVPFGVIPMRFGASLTFLDAVLGTTTLVWLLRKLVGNSRAGRLAMSPERAAVTLLSSVVVVWIAASLVSFVTGSGFSTPSTQTIRFYVKVVMSTLFFVVTVQTVRDRRLLTQLVSALTVGGALASAIGIVLYYLPHSIASRLLSSLRVIGYPSGAGVLRFRVDFNHAERAIATSIDPNVLGGMLVVTTSLALSQAFARKPVVSRAVAIAASALMLFCLLLTYSRGAWLSLMAAIIWMALWQYRRLLVLATIALIIFVQLPISHSFATELRSGIAVQDKAAGMRLGEIHDALRLIGRYPVFGVGFGTAPDADLYVGVSNIYLLMAEETGVVGLCIFLFALLLYGVMMLRGLPRIRDPELRSVAIGLFGAAVGEMSAGMFDRYFFSFPHDIALFWLVLALGVSVIVLDREDEQHAQAPEAVTCESA